MAKYLKTFKLRPKRTPSRNVSFTHCDGFSREQTNPTWSFDSWVRSLELALGPARYETLGPPQNFSTAGTHWPQALIGHEEAEADAVLACLPLTPGRSRLAHNACWHLHNADNCPHMDSLRQPHWAYNPVCHKLNGTKQRRRCLRQHSLCADQREHVGHVGLG